MNITSTRYFFILLIFLLAGVRSNAQLRLSGIIHDSEGQSVQYATVVLKSMSDDFLTGTSTTENGYFELNIERADSFKISVKYLGFAEFEKVLELSASEDLGILKLEPLAKNLTEVVVSAERTVLETKEDQLIFNVQSSPLKSGFDGMEVLQRAPNVWIDQNGEILLLNEKASIWINGRRTNMSRSELADYIQNLPSEEIQRIEIQNSLSANMDGEQSGGLINIVLRKKPIGIRSTVRANQVFRGDGFNRSELGLNLNYGSKLWNVYGAYNLMQHKGNANTFSEIFYHENGNYLQNEQEGNTTVNRQNYRLGFVIEAGRYHIIGAEISGNVLEMDLLNLNELEMSNDQTLLDRGTTEFTSNTDRNRFNSNLNYIWTIPSKSAKLQLYADYAQQDYQTDNLAESNYENGFFPDTLERNDAKSGTEIYALQADWVQNISKDFKIETGFKWTNTQRANNLLSEFRSDGVWLSNDRSTDFEYDETINAAYFSGSKKFGDNYFLRAGLRMENTMLDRVDLIRDTSNAQGYFNWLPSISLTRNLPQKIAVSIGYSKRIRRPSFALLNNDVRKINDFRYEIGNPDLGPEQVHNFSVALKRKGQSLRAYYTLTTEAINGIFFLENDVSFYQKINSGLQKQYGLRYGFTGNLKPWWFFKGSALVYHRKFTDPEGIDAFIQTTARFGMDHNFKIDPRTNLGVNAYYVTPRTDAYYLASERYAVNILASKSFLERRLNAQIGVNDVFNTLVYENVRDFTTFKTTNRRKPRTRTLNVRLTYNFNSKSKVSNRKTKSKNEAGGRLE